ncbi:hypothetical protein [Amycolatopsis sp. NPDC051128]|uniref:hypothetical protein n=1 Tax=Amycolatopsis sp. NPDC051128 TaxID=3155412 RepID=UPI0034126EA8
MTVDHWGEITAVIPSATRVRGTSSSSPASPPTRRISTSGYQLGQDTVDRLASSSTLVTNSYSKDSVENAVKRAVCVGRAGQVTLADAQDAMLSDWTTAKTVLGIG